MLVQNKKKSYIKFFNKIIIHISLDNAPNYSLVTDQAALSTALNCHTVSQTKHDQ